jgi:hypothetical protein
LHLKTTRPSRPNIYEQNAKYILRHRKATRQEKIERWFRNYGEPDYLGTTTVIRYGTPMFCREHIEVP